MFRLVESLANSALINTAPYAGAAIVATVIKGHVLNQMVHTHTDMKTGKITERHSGPKIYGPGESWYEAPGCHHVRSETVGVEEAQFIANMIISNDVLEVLGIKARSAEDDLQRLFESSSLRRRLRSGRPGKLLLNLQSLPLAARLSTHGPVVRLFVALFDTFLF